MVFFIFNVFVVYCELAGRQEGCTNRQGNIRTLGDSWIYNAMHQTSE